MLPELIYGKESILDVTIRAEEKDNINIEMQVARYEYMAERILEYWARKYSEEFKRGEDYVVAKRTICILITCFEMEQVKNIDRFHTKWNIREEKYTDIILTDKLEFHIINLKKLENQKDMSLMDKALLNWCKFIVPPETLEEKIMEENKNIEKAKEALDKLSQDEQERDLAYRREKAIRDINAVRQAGDSDGKKEGINEGIIKRNIDIARSMLKEKLDIEVISKITGLSKEKIEKIK